MGAFTETYCNAFRGGVLLIVCTWLAPSIIWVWCSWRNPRNFTNLWCVFASRSKCWIPPLFLFSFQQTHRDTVVGATRLSILTLKAYEQLGIYSICKAAILYIVSPLGQMIDYWIYCTDSEFISYLKLYLRLPLTDQSTSKHFRVQWKPLMCFTLWNIARLSLWIM